jgi:hypothetical protein
MRPAIHAALLLTLAVHLCAQSHLSAPAKPTTLRDANLTAQVRKDVLAIVLSDVNDGELDAAQALKVALDSTVNLLQLSQRGLPAIEVDSEESPLCGANDIGNCPVDLFTQVNGRAVLVFSTGDGQGIDIQPTMHHGMHDISVANRLNHLTAVAFEVDEFDGKTYKPTYCYESDTDKNGHYVETAHHKC